ncbi:hypothetical protein SSYIS1_07770 [Serratia symbiotica]|uniref:Uncharacterized protein n=1 Tax=Serratia symbiotica TaxID=138074 RepID=A0A455VQN6_9GAMM|nr:hypothetical protein SSYIS1_05570 [Serratia symbiotica]BBI91526.1 hypothetical protein SSYIS1_07770 [Serratia symbiotica]
MTFILYIRPLFIGFTANNDFSAGFNVLCYLMWLNDGEQY